MARLIALLDLVHPGPSLATVAVALVCMAFVAGGVPPLRVLALLGVSLSLQQFAISLHNDFCDRGMDELAKPWRALPSRAARPQAVAALAGTLGVASVIAAMPLGLDEVALVALGLACGALYNAGLKRTALSWLPFVIAFPLIPLFGMAALDVWPSYWPLSFVVVPPLAVAIHLWDSLPDVRGDEAAGARGLAWYVKRYVLRSTSATRPDRPPAPAS